MRRNQFVPNHQTQVGVCERRKNSRQTCSICRQQFANVFADCFCAVHTHQLEFANTGLPTLVCRVKAALDPQYNHHVPTQESIDSLFSHAFCPLI